MRRRLMLLTALLAAPLPATAATLTWTSAVSESTHVAANWSPAQVPTAADDLVWTNAGSIFVLIPPVAATTSRSWTFASGAFKNLLARRTHTVTQSVRSLGGFTTLASVDSIIVPGDLEVQDHGSVTVQQGCRLVGLDSVRVSTGTVHASGFTTLIRANRMLVGGTLTASSQGHLMALQSLGFVPGTGVLSAGASGLITAPSLLAPYGARVLLSGLGRLVLAGDLTLEGELSCETGGRVEAAAVRAQPWSSVTGNGVIDALFVAQDTNVGSYGGTLTVGKAGTPSAVSLTGSLEVSPWSEFECLTATPVTLPASVSMVQGTLRAAPGFVMEAGGYLAASGRVAGNLTLTDSDFAFMPGPNGAGRLAVEGDWEKNGGSTTVTVYDPGTGFAADSLVVTGAARPGGALNLYTPYPEPSGVSIPFLFYGSRPGGREFDTVTLNGVEVTDEVQVQYQADRAVLVFGGTVSVGGGAAAPRALAFVGRSGSRAALELSLPDAAEASVRLFDVAGRERGRLHEGALAAGVHRFELGAAGDPGPGVYFGRAHVRSADGEARFRVARVVRWR